MANALPTEISEEKRETARILMVDDNPQNLQVLHEALRALRAAKRGCPELNQSA